MKKDTKFTAEPHYNNKHVLVGHLNPVPKNKSQIKIGNMIIPNTHRFCWLHRKMMKLFFGFEVTNLKEEQTELTTYNKKENDDESRNRY